MYSVTFSCVISSVYFTNAPLNRLKSPLSKPAASQMLELLKHHLWTCPAVCEKITEQFKGACEMLKISDSSL